MKINKVITAVLFFIFVNGCVTAPPERSNEQIEADLEQLVSAGDELGIRNYFKVHESCKDPQPLTRCLGQKQGFQAFGIFFSVDEFLSGINIAHKNLIEGIAKCGSDLVCLGNIQLYDVAICSDKSQGRKTKCIMNKKDKFLSVENIDDAGKKFLISANDLKEFMSVFKPLAEKATMEFKENEIKVSAENKKKELFRSAAFDQLNQANCTQLIGFQVNQKLGPKEYIIGTPDSMHGGLCLEQTGSCTPVFSMQGQHGHLITVKTDFDYKEFIGREVYVNEVGYKTFKLKSGYTEKVKSFKENIKCNTIGAKLRESY